MKKMLFKHRRHFEKDDIYLAKENKNYTYFFIFSPLIQNSSGDSIWLKSECGATMKIINVFSAFLFKQLASHNTNINLQRIISIDLFLYMYLRFI